MKIDNCDLDQYTFIIAEIGNNHEGDLRLAKEMIRLAKESGVNAVKFQTIRPERFISNREKKKFDQLKSYELTDTEFAQLAELANSLDLYFLSTPFDPVSVEMLDPLAPAFKIASGDLTNHPLLKCIASKGKPVLLSTGMANADEIAGALEIIDSHSPLPPSDRVVLLHCISAYPTPEEQANLRSISFLKERFGRTVGYSDHTLGILACQTAVALGARVIEKHFTYRKENQTFRDHSLSADPADMENLVNNIRHIEKSLGEYGKPVLPCEIENRKIMRRSIVLKKNLSQGASLRDEDVDFYRPGQGIGPDSLGKFLGRKAARDLTAGHFIEESDFA